MTTPNHIAQSVLIASFFKNDWKVMLIAGILGLLPDIGTLFHKGDDWTVYEKLHKVTWWKMLIPFYNLHLIEDYYTHDKINGGWKPSTYFIEAGLWIIMAAVLIIKLIY